MVGSGATMETIKERAKALWIDLGLFLVDEEDEGVEVEEQHAVLCELENLLDEMFGFSDQDEAPST